MIITLLIHQYITQIQENTIKKQTQGKSTSQQQMVPLFVIMQRSQVFAYSQCHHKKNKNKKPSWADLSEKWKEQSVRQTQQGSAWALQTSLGIYQGPVSWEGAVDFQAGAFSYALISNYVPVVCLMLPDTINGCLMVSPGQTRHSTLQTLNIYISLQRRSRIPHWPMQWRERKERLSLHKHYVMKYKWINGPCWGDGISRQNLPYRLSTIYNHDILIDVTNKHELFSLGIRAGYLFLCMLHAYRHNNNL